MTNTACLYAIVRFCPFIETEEFANVGIVMVSPDSNFFGFKLMSRKYARVTGFFEQLDVTVYRTVIANLRDELDRAAQLLKDQLCLHQPSGDTTLAKALFLEVVRPRETVLKFGAVRAVMAENPQLKLDELYGHYVERDFVTKEYRETVLERTMRKWLFTAGLGQRFEKFDVGSEEYHVTFPFVERGVTATLKAIKPLDLSQDQPSKILEHGGHWLFRVNTLKRKGLLPGLVLFPAEGPLEDGPRKRAYSEIVGELKEAGATVLNYTDKAAIMERVSQ